MSDGMYAPQCSPTKPCGWDETGCGFSNKDADPKNNFHQNKVVNNYLKSAKSKYKPVFSKAGTFNEKGRAYPDLSLLAQFGIPLCTYGGCSGSGGTSASAPEMAGMISLINDKRLNNGLNTLG